MVTDSSASGACPSARPKSPHFSSGPCKKHPGWSLAALQTDTLGRSHRAEPGKSRLKQAIDRSHQLLNLPSDWRLAIVAGSDTGAFEMALWSMLGERPVDVFAWESFSGDWAGDIGQHLALEHNLHRADYGQLPDLSQAKADNDTVFVFNGTTSGVRVPNLDWIADKREGLVFCDATSAAYAMPMDFNKLDVVTWSWQKVLGGEAGFGMLALSPAAVARLERYTPARPLPKLFRMTKKGKINEALFAGATINTPSMIAVEDLHSALDWADSIGGVDALIARCDANQRAVADWVERTDWIEWLAESAEIRSSTALCLKIVDPAFTALDTAAQSAAVKSMCSLLAKEGVAFDINAYRDAPPGLRIWGGATVDAEDLQCLTAWLDWAFAQWVSSQQAGK